MNIRPARPNDVPLILELIRELAEFEKLLPEVKATEESLRAFTKAIELGVTTLELDIVLAKDGAPMVWHDPAIQSDKCADTGPAFAGDPQYPYVGKLVHDLAGVAGSAKMWLDDQLRRNRD